MDTSQNVNFNMNIAVSDGLHNEVVRLRTFEKWPLDFIDVKELAMTGMYYTGDQDKTACHFCGVEIFKWQDGDFPVIEHLRWSPSCLLMRRRITCNIPINPDRLDKLLPPLSYDVCGKGY